MAQLWSTVSDGSELPNPTRPEVLVNLATIIDPHPGSATALISRGRMTDYDTLRDQVGSVRGGLTGLGLDPGDRVALVCANNWYFVVNYLAILGIGAVAVPLNPLSPPQELEREMSAVGARALVVGPGGPGHRLGHRSSRRTRPGAPHRHRGDRRRRNGVVRLAPPG